MKISKNKKCVGFFFVMSLGSFNIRIWFLVKRCALCPQTDTHESDYRGHPFRVSGVFPSTYHQYDCYPPVIVTCIK